MHVRQHKPDLLTGMVLIFLNNRIGARLLANGPKKYNDYFEPLLAQKQFENTKLAERWSRA